MFCAGEFPCPPLIYLIIYEKAKVFFSFFGLFLFQYGIERLLGTKKEESFSFLCFLFFTYN